MGLSKRSPCVVTINGEIFRCVVCQGGLFTSRTIKLNTGAMEFLDLAWANKSSLGLICTNCGYVHEFLGDAVQLWDPGSGAGG
ncbi:hypothetical protein NCC78_17475 [Micromonospora phytophila]|uniref:hypothetical protein n=1 Tax=Micromonospora phytophila TaxID=709888 RepID=UPI00202F5CF0|nr:hypothetical protein [Micromonospora phytophila]MCM0676463.1 hypothetical protein [Micromonospora phytophila]